MSQSGKYKWLSTTLKYQKQTLDFMSGTMSEFALGHGNLQSHLMPGVFYVVTAYELCWHPFFPFLH